MTNALKGLEGFDESHSKAAPPGVRDPLLICANSVVAPNPNRYGRRIDRAIVEVAEYSVASRAGSSL